GLVSGFLYIAAYAGLVALSVPGAAVLTIAGGFLFGTWLGTLCAVVGATLGATGVFLGTRAGLGGAGEGAGAAARRAPAALSRGRVQLSAGLAAGLHCPVLARQPRPGIGRRQVVDLYPRHLSRDHSWDLRLCQLWQRSRQCRRRARSRGLAKAERDRPDHRAR